MKITLDLDVNNLSGKDIRVLKAIIDTSALQEVRISNPAVMAEVLKPDTVVPPTPKVEPLPVKPKAEPVVPPTPPVAAPIEPVVPPAPVAQTPTEAFGTPAAPAAPVAPAAPAAPAAPVAPVPAIPAAPVVEQPESAVELDSAGVPWDAEIHSSGKSFVKDGTWKRKRGVTDDEYNERVRELLGAKKPEPSDIPAAPAANAPMNWSDLMRLITPKVAGANPEIQMEHINAWLSARGITEGFGVLARRPDLFPEFCEDFKLC